MSQLNFFEIYARIDALETKTNQTAQETLAKLNSTIDALRLVRDEVVKDFKRQQEELALIRTAAVVAKSDARNNTERDAYVFTATAGSEG